MKKVPLPPAVEKLNYAQFCPIVLYLRVETKQLLKELRAVAPKCVGGGFIFISLNLEPSNGKYILLGCGC